MTYWATTSPIAVRLRWRDAAGRDRTRTIPGVSERRDAVSSIPQARSPVGTVLGWLFPDAVDVDRTPRGAWTVQHRGSPPDVHALHPAALDPAPGTRSRAAWRKQRGAPS